MKETREETISLCGVRRERQPWLDVSQSARRRIPAPASGHPAIELGGRSRNQRNEEDNQRNEGSRL